MKASERALNKALIKKLGTVALECLTGEHFISETNKIWINKDVAAHFIIMFGHDDKGNRLSNKKAANLFRVYCKLINRYAYTQPEFQTQSPRKAARTRTKSSGRKSGR